MRRTINKPFSLEGAGLHKGEKSIFSFRPQQEPLGARFLINGSCIVASLSNLHSTVRGTNLSDGKNTVYTVEHLLSALSAFGVDDIDIEVSGIEPPAMDGSSLPFARALLSSGFTDKDQPGRKVFSLNSRAEFSAGNSMYTVEPANGFFLEVFFENKHPLIGSQNFLFEVKEENYTGQIAPARTFGFIHEIEYLRKNGLALGGSLDNAVVLTEDGIMNKDGLRYRDEFVRHKILDLLGDLYLTGLKFENVKITGRRTSHEANAAFASFICGRQQ